MIIEGSKLELGCGAKPTPGYLHQDVIELPDIKLDFLCNPWEIPLQPDSVSEIIALGVMEHLRYEDFTQTLRYIYKLLTKDGCFLFDVPDMVVWSEYLYNVTHGLSEKNRFPDEHVWATIYGWQRWPGDEHKSGWTKEKLFKLLAEEKFKFIEEGPQIFLSKGIQRNRFVCSRDAHLYLRIGK